MESTLLALESECLDKITHFPVFTECVDWRVNLFVETLGKVDVDFRVGGGVKVGAVIGRMDLN